MHVFHLKIKAYRFFYMQCVYVSTPNNWDKEKIKNQYVLIFFSDISIYFDKSERQSMIKKKNKPHLINGYHAFRLYKLKPIVFVYRIWTINGFRFKAM